MTKKRRNGGRNKHGRGHVSDAIAVIPRPGARSCDSPPPGGGRPADAASRAHPSVPGAGTRVSEWLESCLRAGPETGRRAAAGRSAACAAASCYAACRRRLRRNRGCTLVPQTQVKRVRCEASGVMVPKVRPWAKSPQVSIGDGPAAGSAHRRWQHAPPHRCGGSQHLRRCCRCRAYVW